MRENRTPSIRSQTADATINTSLRYKKKIKRTNLKYNWIRTNISGISSGVLPLDDIFNLFDKLSANN